MSRSDSPISNENFLEQIINEDLSNGFDKSKLRFRFPPEPNGYLHIGHAKSICLNFGFGKTFSSPVNLRFDDTNPEKENKTFINSIKEDIKWLGFTWDSECYASDYFDKLFDWAIHLIKKIKLMLTFKIKKPFQNNVVSLQALVFLALTGKEK